MPRRMHQAVLAIALLGAVLGLVALSRAMSSSGSIALAPVVVFPYALLALASRAAREALPQAILLAVAFLFVGLGYRSLTPSTDAQGGLIVVAAPMLQSGAAVLVYVVLRLFGALPVRATVPPTES